MAEASDVSSWQEFLRWIGVASAADVEKISGRMSQLEHMLDQRFRDMQAECDALGQRFSGHKRKTETELQQLHAEIAQVLRILERNRETEQNTEHYTKLGNMIRTLKARQTRAMNARQAIMPGTDASIALAVNDG